MAGRPQMHAGQVATDAGLVRRLVAAQCPQWADLPITPVVTFGTDHDIYRLGDHLSVRLPCIGWASAQAHKEAEWLPKLRPHLPLVVSEVLALGAPGEGYPFGWSVQEWLPGTDASAADFDPDRAADDLAAFIRALRACDTAGAPVRPARERGAPLVELDATVRGSLDRLGDRIDGVTALRLWEESLEAGVWDGPETWVNGDLLPGNLLVVDGRLSAVIDWGGLNVGDPACDLQPAWNVFQGEGRRRFRDALEVDEASWLRGRGWALCQALAALPYYWDTNPGMVRQAKLALGEVLGGCR